jgi:hypothetical protein
LKKKTILGFTATFSNLMKKIAERIISENTIIRYQRLYELIIGTSPV